MSELEKLIDENQGGLKECPFCSSPAHLAESGMPDPEGLNYFICCNSCGAYMGDYSKEHAPEAWNDRECEDRLRQICGVLEEALKNLQYFAKEARQNLNKSQIVNPVSRWGSGGDGALYAILDVEHHTKQALARAEEIAKGE